MEELALFVDCERRCYTAYLAGDVVADDHADDVLSGAKFQRILHVDFAGAQRGHLRVGHRHGDGLADGSNRFAAFAVGDVGGCGKVEVEVVLSVAGLDRHAVGRQMDEELNLFLCAVAGSPQPLHAQRHARAFDGRTKGIDQVGAPRRVKIHARVGDEETLASTDFGVSLIYLDLELAPAGVVIVGIEVVAGEVVGSAIVSRPFEAGGEIVGVVEGLATGHIRELVEGIDSRLLEPGAGGDLVRDLRSVRATSGASDGLGIAHGRIAYEAANVHRINGDLGGVQSLHGALIERGKISAGERLRGRDCEGKSAGGPDQRLAPGNAGKIPRNLQEPVQGFFDGFWPLEGRGKYVAERDEGGGCSEGPVDVGGKLRNISDSSVRLRVLAEALRGRRLLAGSS
jgi:hypothetical protein